MSSSRSRSSRGSRASSSTGRRRRASSDGLRKHVLKKNHLLSEKLTPRRPSVFDLTGEQIIRIKRTVSIGDDAIAIFTTVFVYDSQLTTNQFDETQGKLKDVELDKYFRPEQNRNPMETISQTVSYTAKMIKLTRTTTLDKKYLDQEWKMEETRGIREGFVSRLALDKEMPTSIGSRNQSTCTEADGYKNETFLIFSFDDDGAVKGLMLKAHYRKREERPDMEHCILLESNVKHGTNAVTMFLDAHLKPKVSELETGSYVEEIRQYKFNPSKSQLNELETTYKSTPGIKNTSNDKIVYWSTPSTKKSHYMSSDLNDSASISSSVHPIAIPGPQSHEKVPRLKLPDTPETDVQTAVLLHSPLKKVEKIEAGVTLPVEDLTMSVEVSKVEDKTRKHTLILSAEIGGKQYEFTANIHWNRGPKDFIPKRVLIDGNNIWQQSKDWNPSSSVTRSQINMSSNDTK